MSHISVRASGFSGNYAFVNANRLLDVDELDVIRAVVTVGSQQTSDLEGFGVHSVLKNVALACTALCVLDFSGLQLSRSQLFNSLEVSEKGNFSYWLGMCFAKLFAEEFMQIAWLAHADPLIRSGVASLTPSTRSRGDLLGYDLTANWHVFEAKGRSNSVGRDLADWAKSQAERITHVANLPTVTHCASILRHFETPIALEVIDPPSDKMGSGIHLAVPDFFEQYYRPIIEYLDAAESKVDARHGLKFRIAPLVSVGWLDGHVRIGLEERIHKDPSVALDVGSEMRRLVPQTLSAEDTEQAEVSAPKESLGRDGILIEGEFRVPIGK